MPNVSVRTMGYRLILMLVLLMAGLNLSYGHTGHTKEHHQARAAVEAGLILPLKEVLLRIATQYPGEMVSVKYKQDDGRYDYKLKWLQPSGALIQIRVDAKTGDLMEVKGRNIE